MQKMQVGAPYKKKSNQMFVYLVAAVLVLFIIVIFVVFGAKIGGTSSYSIFAPSSPSFAPIVPVCNTEHLSQYLSCTAKPIDTNSLQFSTTETIKTIHTLQKELIQQVIETDYISISKKDSFEEELIVGDGTPRKERLDNHDDYWGKVYTAGKSYLTKGGHAKPMALWQAMYDFENDPSMSLSGSTSESMDAFATMQTMKWNGMDINVPADMLNIGFRQLLLRKAGIYLQSIGFGPGVNQDGIFIETGAGWGRNLFYLLNNLFMPSRTARVYMGEFSSSGRAVSRMLGDLRRIETEDNNVYVGPFDYYNPSLCKF